MTLAVLSNGTTIQHLGVAIEDVTSIKGAQIENAIVDVTSLDSLSKENISGLSSPNNFTIEMNWINSATQRGLRDSSTSDAFRINLPDGTIYTFNALVDSFQIVPESGGALKATVSIRADYVSWGESSAFTGNTYFLVSGVATEAQVLAGGVATDLTTLN